MKITKAQLKEFAPRATAKAVAALTGAEGTALLKAAEIDTPMRLCQAMAQWATETMGFRKFSESGNYSEKRLRQIFPRHFSAAQAKSYARKPEKILNRAYANRLGNGNEASGDGWRFRGGGMAHTTGKYNYGKIKRQFDPNVIRTDMIEALRSACQFWIDNNMNALADTGDVKKVSRRLNGGYNGLTDRRYYFKQAFEIWGDMDEDVVGVTVAKPVRASTTVWTTTAKAGAVVTAAASATGQLKNVAADIVEVVPEGFMPNSNLVFVAICLFAAAALAYVVWRKHQDYQL